ncbi:peptide-methionine (R)-S-oxide reductase MsrB [Sphingomonas sp. Y38-1Y]|uniref:peptide-methionine (R)-S-oxide reductase MsrB n=1 Tax=Sphingomonas sp. Y38-1Y TaxID=3078265 RepID=UPI0028E4C9E5|nr:peptide-methionine (R)-S-oxide reductase MsrB [Sphingomonas sp. Y38-1Y]
MSTPLPDRRGFLSSAALAVLATACGSPPSRAAERYPFMLSDAEWRKRLSPAAYGVLRDGDTERPYSSPLNKEKRRGIFSCAGCELPLFLSSTKFESGTGWPSFYAARDNAVIERADNTLGMRRTEILCRRCGGHLGHVFDDGPPPTGKRYCMNGVALSFRPA